jgi:hypothetical protein
MVATWQEGEDVIDHPVPTNTRSRRAILAGAIGGLAGLIAGRLGAPDHASAAAGDPLLIGNTGNNAGISNTTLTTASSGTALLVTQNGTGTALRGSAVGVGSIAGFFTASYGTGISGVTGNPGSYGVFGANDGTAGTGGGIRANGHSNHGLVASTTSGSQHAVFAIQSGPSSSGAAVYGDGNANFGVIGTTDGPLAYGVAGINSADGGVGVFGTATKTGVHGLANDTSSTGMLGESVGFQGIGVYGWANASTTQNYGVYARTESATGWGVWSSGDLMVDGDLFASGSKVGYVADVAVNASKATLHQGDAVALVGVRPAVLGKIPLLEVGPAKAGDPIIGIVDRLAEVSTATGPKGLAGTNPSIHGRGTTVKPGDHLLVVTMGAFAVAGADASAGSIAIGDELTVGAKPGKLAKSKGNGRSAGYALGSLATGTGKVGIFVSPR